MKKYMISVIVPIYNVELYLRECIESILSQTYTSLEIILVDDGSTDSCGMICDEYAAKDDRILVIHKENGGLVTARKAGLAVATGRYIGFVDGDDYVEPDFYETLYGKIEENNTDFVQCAGVGEKENGEPEYLCCWKTDKYVVSDRKEVVVPFFRNFVTREGFIDEHIWNKLFLGEFIKKWYELTPDYQQHGEDFLCMCEVMLHCRSFVSIDRKLYHYRVREGSLSHNGEGEMINKMSNLIALLRMKCWIGNSYFSEVSDLLDRVFWKSLCYHWKADFGERIRYFRLPEIEWFKGKKVVLYGAGVCGECYYSQLCVYSQIEVVAWADKRAGEITCEYMEIVFPDAVPAMDYDVLLIAVENERISEEIRRELVEKGIPEEKIVWREPGKIC